MMDKKDRKNLKKRYLVWLYKSTKEALDKIERKFTQLEIDSSMLKELKNLDKKDKAKKFIEDFAGYIQNKAKDGVTLKYENDKLKPEYYFLLLKLKATEKTILTEFGKKFLDEVKALYEMEMTERILKSKEH